MNVDARVILNRQIPFVDTIFRIIEGRDSYEDAVTLLIEAEDRHGLRIVHDAIGGSWAVSLLPVEGFRPTLRELIELNSDINRLRLYYLDASAEVEEAADRRSLFPFISDVSFLVGGTDFANDHFVQFSSGLLSSWTQRAWGACLAEWANATDWMPEYRNRQGWSKWSHAEFCYYLHAIIDQYEQWAEAVLHVIQLKCRRQLAADTKHDCP